MSGFRVVLTGEGKGPPDNMNLDIHIDSFKKWENNTPQSINRIYLPWEIRLQTESIISEVYIYCCYLLPPLYAARCNTALFIILFLFCFVLTIPEFSNICERRANQEKGEQFAFCHRSVTYTFSPKASGYLGLGRISTRTNGS